MKIKLTCLALLSVSAVVRAQNIATWDFDDGGTMAAPYNGPSATSGANGGIASVLGMNNSYNSTNSIAYADVESLAGASTGSGSYSWRIRGGSTAHGAGKPNGWSSQAPIGTQGAEFQASTAGFDDIQISFDINNTTQGARNLELLYTIDGSTWINATLSSGGTLGTLETGSASDANTVDGSYVELSASGTGWNNQITASLSGISEVNNDANFGIEIVNASTGADAVNAAGTALNNTSGNWSYDNISITGTATATPEPTSIALAGVGAVAGLLALRRNRKA